MDVRNPLATLGHQYNYRHFITHHGVGAFPVASGAILSILAASFDRPMFFNDSVPTEASLGISLILGSLWVLL